MDAYWAPANPTRFRVEGSRAADPPIETCSGMSLRNTYQVMTMIVRMTGAVHAAKIPSFGEMAMAIGSSNNFAIENEMFSTATHGDARSPISTESWSAKIVHRLSLIHI